MSELSLFGKLFGDVVKLIYATTDVESQQSEKKEAKTDRAILTFKECVDWAKSKKAQYSKVENMMISVKKNQNSKSDKDKLIVTLAVADDRDEPISKNGKSSISKVYIVQRLDKGLIQALDGEESVIISLL